MPASTKTIGDSSILKMNKKKYGFILCIGGLLTYSAMSIHRQNYYLKGNQQNSNISTKFQEMQRNQAKYENEIEEYIDPIVDTGSTTPSRNFTTLLPSDVIYSRDWWEIPTVIPEYKLIFFSIPKVACTEWKLLFRRMNELSYKPSENNVTKYQDPYYNGIMTIDQYPLHEAERMMNSQEWTRAIFVREPKERIKSAFLNKFVVDRSYFRHKCCREEVMPDKQGRNFCEDMMDIKNFTYFLERTRDCHDPHWTPQWPVVDEKWWSSMDFIGHMEDVASDAKKLLKSLISLNSKGKITTAWEEHGKSGWGKNGIDGFMQMNSAGHGTNATNSLCQVFRPEHEEYVEKHWDVEWKNDYMGYEKTTMCTDSTISRKLTSH